MYSKFLVFKKVRENKVVTSFYLKPSEEGKIIEHKAGQFISVKPIKEEENSKAIRQYSLSMKPGSDYYRISVKRHDQGLVSQYMHDIIKEGDEIEITVPLGKFTLKENEKPLVLISAGIGITPLISMLYKALDSNRRIIFIQAVTNSTEQTFRDEINEIAENNKNVEKVVFYSKPLDEKLSVDYDYEGYINKDWIEKNLPKDGDFYFCGPVPFMKNVYDSLIAIGVAEENINYENFGPSANLGKV
jgi:nitric oxide dioxygenase